MSHPQRPDRLELPDELEGTTADHIYAWAHQRIPAGWSRESRENHIERATVAVWTLYAEWNECGRKFEGSPAPFNEFARVKFVSCSRTLQMEDNPEQFEYDEKGRRRWSSTAPLANPEPIDNLGDEEAIDRPEDMDTAQALADAMDRCRIAPASQAHLLAMVFDESRADSPYSIAKEMGQRSPQGRVSAATGPYLAMQEVRKLARLSSDSFTFLKQDGKPDE